MVNQLSEHKHLGLVLDSKHLLIILTITYRKLINS